MEPSASKIKPQSFPILVLSMVLTFILPFSIPFIGVFQQKGWSSFGYFGYALFISIAGLFFEYQASRATKNSFFRFLLVPLIALVFSALIFYFIRADFQSWAI